VAQAAPSFASGCHWEASKTLKGWLVANRGCKLMKISQPQQGNNKATPQPRTTNTDSNGESDDSADADDDDGGQNNDGGGCDGFDDGGNASDCGNDTGNGNSDNLEVMMLQVIRLILSPYY